MQPWAGGSEDVVEWWPGKPNPRQLTGTVRTLDNAEGKDAVTIFTEAAMRCDALPAGMQSGMKDDAHCAMGVISRDGWAVLDDTTTGRFDGSSSRGGWDWVSPRDAAEAAAERAALQADGDVRCTGWARSGECEANPDFMRSSCKAACEREAARRQQATAIGEGVQRRVDWYLFGAGLDFKGALRDLSLLSGEQPIPPRYAFGVWFSRWWPYADWESRALLKEFDARGVPCDVLITDMDWHHTCYRRTYGKEDEKSMDASHNWPCWSGFTFDRKYFANPESFLGWCKARGVHNGFNLHFQSGLVKAEEAAEHWTAFSRAMGLPPSAEFAAFDPLNMSYSSHFHTHVLAPLERKGVDFWWLDWQQGEGLFGSSDVPEANPTWWLNYVYGTQPDGREKRAVGTHTNTGTSTGTGTGTGSGGVRGGMGGGAGGDREDGDQPAAPSGGGAAAGGEVAGPVALPLRRRMIMHRWGSATSATPSDSRATRLLPGRRSASNHTSPPPPPTSTLATGRTTSVASTSHVSQSSTSDGYNSAFSPPSFVRTASARPTSRSASGSLAISTLCRCARRFGCASSSCPTCTPPRVPPTTAPRRQYVRSTTNGRPSRRAMPIRISTCSATASSSLQSRSAPTPTRRSRAPCRFGCRLAVGCSWRPAWRWTVRAPSAAPSRWARSRSL